MTRVKGAAHQTFRALGSHNYRLYFFGQIVSVSGSWMQSVALGWLVLQRASATCGASRRCALPCC